MSPYLSPSRPRTPATLRTAAIAAVAAGLAAGAIVVPSAAQSAPAQVRSATPPASTLAVIKTIGVGVGPGGLAIDSDDDSVYVANYVSGTVSVISGSTGQGAATITVGADSNPRGVAVNQSDDTVYVSSEGSTPNPFPYLIVVNGRTGQLDDSIAITARSGLVAVNQIDDTVYVSWRGGTGNGTWITIINGRSQAVDDTLTVGQGPYGLAVNDSDDTVYVANFGLDGTPSTAISVINGLTDTVANTLTGGTRPHEVAVNQVDDTVYVTNRDSNNVSVIDGVTDAVIGTIAVGPMPVGVAVDQADDTVYVANRTSYGASAIGSVSVINGRTGVRTDDTVTVGASPVGVAVDGSGTNAGLVYVANSGTDNVSVIGRVTPTSTPASGDAGSVVTVNVDVPQVAYDVDDSTVASVRFGGVAGTSLTPGAGDAWTVVAPAGSGTVPVTVTFAGGLTASAGTFTYPSPTPPAPDPVYPPGAPTDVTAEAGDASATVTWRAPANSGSYPITNYRVVARPGGQTCLVSSPTLTCTVSGLTNGESYTFTVEALNGAGWGAKSEASAPVTPESRQSRLVLNQGTRTADGVHDRITTTGTSVNVPAGVKLTPYIRYSGQSTFSEGKATITVASDGTFRWSRKIRKDRGITAYVAWESVTSNQVFWAKIR